MIKKLIKTINRNLFLGNMTTEVAYELLECLSILTEKNYRILNARVVYEENEKFHDAFVN